MRISLDTTFRSITVRFERDEYSLQFRGPYCAPLAMIAKAFYANRYDEEPINGTILWQIKDRRKPKTLALRALGDEARGMTWAVGPDEYVGADLRVHRYDEGDTK